jgi:hypothetical protein
MVDSAKERRGEKRREDLWGEGAEHGMGRETGEWLEAEQIFCLW